MGGKDSRPVAVTYDEAVKRVTQQELKRLREAYRKACFGQSMSLDIFIREVIGTGVPHAVAEQIFIAFSSNGKSLTFKELLCGLVLFTRATERNEEKIKFLFGLYADESLHIHKEVIDEIILKTDGQIPEPLSELFEHKDKVDYNEFKRWLYNYPEFSSLSYWLILEPSDNCTLTLDADLPSFYQTLAGVTHLEENEIVYLEAKYNKLRATSLSGRFDIELFRRLVSPPLPQSLTDSLYKAFDENVDGHIDFKEMVCGLSACCKGPEVERHKFCFRVFDLDQDGYLSKAELIGAIEASFTVLQQSEHSDTVADLLEMDAYTMAAEIIDSHGDSKEGRLAQEEFLIWSFQSKVPQGFAELLFEVCHVILGLKPSSRDEEGKVVKGWLSREVKRGYQLGQTWYLVSSTWWRQWQDYVADNVVLEAIELDNSFDAVQTSNDPYEKRYAERSVPDNNSNTKLLHPPRPGPIDNSRLVITPPHSTKISTWTNEGGILKPRIQKGRDYEVVPELLWQALHSWYGGELQLPRPVVIPRNTTDKATMIELYSLQVKLFKHQAPHQNPHQPITTVAGVTGGIANFAMNVAGIHNSSVKRVQTSTATFSHQHSLRQITDFLAQRLKVSRDDLRLWKFLSVDNELEQLEGDEKLLEDLGITDNQHILMEVRNPDLTWPEEMLQLIKKQQNKDKDKSQGDTRVEPGTTGLSNLGNTCFMNSAIQCVSNCKPLTDYFTNELHLYELNRNNPLGMKGRLAQLYGKLISSLWDGTHRNLPPVELRYTLAKYAPQFNGCQQHDAQELLAFLLDGLHEDLNRVQNKPYVELKDSNGRRDEIVAREGWDYHLLRNRSIIVDLFHGQLKSLVRCKRCSHTSVRFDPFTYLSLPLPMENSLMIEVIVLSKDGIRPVKYGIKLNSDDKYKDIRKPLSDYTSIDGDKLLFVELNGAHVKTFPMDSQKIKQRIGSVQPLYAYEMEHAIPAEPVETTTEPASNGHIPNGNGAPVLNGNGHARTNGNLPNGNGVLPNQNSLSPRMNGRPSNKSFNLSPNNTLGKKEKSHKRNQSNASSSTMNISIDSLHTEASKPDGLVVAVHRKMERREFYFLAPRQSIPSIFGTPVIFQTTSMTTHRDMYHYVWTMIKRFVTGHPVTERCNHAQDCDGSLGNEYPFTLLMTKRCGTICAKCPYYKFCRGCLIDYTEELFDSKCDYIAIDWDPTAYYLRYQASTETVHSSVTEVHNSDDPVNIQKCLESFTREEQLSEEELWFCSKCKQHRMATKKLEIWRLPPVLIIHLKRFQFLSNRWIKSQKSVDFPVKDFDPEQYLAVRSMSEDYRRAGSFSEPGTPNQGGDHLPPMMMNGSMASMNNYLEESDGAESMHSKFAQSRTKTESMTSYDSLDYSQTKYDLFALSCHRGNLGGGHYVACTKNPNNGKWYEYNDSMVKEMSESSVAAVNQRNSYILFYKRQGYNFDCLMPDVSSKSRDDKGIDDEFNSELSKAASCCIQ